MIRPEDVAEVVRCLLRLSPACMIPEVMMIRPADLQLGRPGPSLRRRRSARARARRGLRPAHRAPRRGSRPSAGTGRARHPALRGAGGCGRGRRAASRIAALVLGPDARLELRRERAHLALARAARALAGAGEAVPGAREAAEVGAPAAAVRGEHRAHAAGAVGVGADDDPVVAAACPRASPPACRTAGSRRPGAGAGPRGDGAGAASCADVTGSCHLGADALRIS